MMPPSDELVRDFLLGSVSGRVLSWAPSLFDPPLDAAIAIGAFDGVHLGHRLLADRLLEETSAAVEGDPALAPVIVTFDPDPDRIVSDRPAKRLMGTSDRLRALAASGATVLVVPFTQEVAGLDHAAFFAMLEQAGLRIRSVHVGSDFRLGARAKSDVAVLRAWGAYRGIEVHGHELLLDDGKPVSASRLRRLIACGDVEAAIDELGRRYMVRGLVAHGRGEGTGMGFPTANVQVDAAIQLPADGVYSGLALIEGTVWPAAVNVGVPPMFADSASSASLEANLLGFEGDIYGCEISLAFCRRLRPSLKFDSQDELIARVLADIETIRNELGDQGVRI